MTINRWSSFEGSSAPRPQVAPGTPCAPCTAKGHFCAAFEIVDSRAVCACCLDGVPCMRVPREGMTLQVANVTLRGPNAALRTRPAPAVKVLPQPALAAGAEASPVMPARRQFLQSAAQRGTCRVCLQANHSGPCICSRGCGRPRHSGLCRRVAVNDAAAAKVSVAKTVATRGHCVVCKQPEHTGPCMCVRGCGKTRHRGSCVGMVRNAFPKAEEATRGVCQVPPAGWRCTRERRHDGPCAALVDVTAAGMLSVDEVLAGAARVAKVAKVENVTVGTKVAEAGSEMAKSSKLSDDGYKVISLAEMPGRKYTGVYDEIMAEFMKLPKCSVLTKTFDNREMANTYMLAIVRIGRKSGLKMRQKQDGNTMYVWQV